MKQIRKCKTFRDVANSCILETKDGKLIPVSKVLNKNDYLQLDKLDKAKR